MASITTSVYTITFRKMRFTQRSQNFAEALTLRAEIGEKRNIAVTHIVMAILPFQEQEFEKVASLATFRRKYSAL